jgi:hypothetical protein
MIEGFEKYTEELSEDEKALLPSFVRGLKGKKGKQNAITNKAIQAAFQAHEKWQIKIPDARVRKIINHIRVNGLVKGLCASSKGYYVASNQQELEEYLEGLSQRISSQMMVYDSVEWQLMEWKKFGSL